MANDYIRGVATTGLGGYGLVQSIDWSGEADEDVAKDEDGVTAYHQPFDARVNATANIRFDRDATLPQTGDVITLANCENADYNGAYTVLSPPNVNASNVAGPVVTLNLRRYIDGLLPVSGS